MLTRLRSQIGTAGLVVAIIALVAALGGGAYAATGGADGGKATASAKQGKQGKPGKPGKPGPAGPVGPAGLAGAAGPQGPAGPKGDTGATGAAGTPGKNGKDGETGFTETLPSEKTETGSWAAAYTEPGSLVGIPFAIPLAAPLDQNHVIKTVVGYNGENEANVEEENCPGAAANPKAAPGFLCVYLGYAVTESKIESIFDPTKGPFESPGAATAGAALLMAAPEGIASGTWAVTAP